MEGLIDMADVRLQIGGREYVVTCRDGEEARLNTLGAMVSKKVEEAGSAANGLNESRQLLFASLLLADKLDELQAGGNAPSPNHGKISDDIDPEKLAATLEKLADRLEAVTNKLEI
jgi:cell division protein ZapA